MESKKIRSCLFLAILSGGIFLLLVLSAVYSQSITQWLVAQGIRGAWLRATVVLLLATCMFVATDLSLWIVNFPVRRTQWRYFSKLYGYLLGTLISMLLWSVVAGYAAPVARPYLPGGLAGWAEFIVLVTGIVVLGFLANRVARRLGLPDFFGRRKRSDRPGEPL